MLLAMQELTNIINFYLKVQIKRLVRARVYEIWTSTIQLMINQGLIVNDWPKY